MPLFHLSLGSNLGDRQTNLARALDRLRAAGFDVQRVSSLYETEPVGEAAGPGWFLNAAAAVSGPFSAGEALARCLGVERALGRERTTVGGPRTLDIDLLLAGDLVLEEEGLTVPHPRMHVRRFVLAPLAEIAGSVVHPRLRLSVDEMLQRCADLSRVIRCDALDWQNMSARSDVDGAELRVPDSLGAARASSQRLPESDSALERAGDLARENAVRIRPNRRDPDRRREVSK